VERRLTLKWLALFVRLGLGVVSLTVGGCAIHYFDEATGTEHIWGFGHLAMKPGAPTEGVRAVARRTDIIGLSVGKVQEGPYLALGWDARQRIEILEDSTAVCLAWPQGSFYNARIGSHFPPKLDDCAQSAKGNK
jgi:hypothetical protein